MADNNGLFFNSINGDRVYNADSFAEWLQKFFTTGVFNGEMQVTPGSGMMVNVAPGYANINGKVRFFDTMQAFTIDPASGTYPRIDAIMVRLDETARNISAVYVKGDYSGDSPTAPAPVRSEGVYDIVLAHIAVNAGQTAITAANITDTRADDEICGWVTSTVEGVPMDQIVSQMQADFLAWYDRMKDQLSEDAAGHLQAEIDTLSEALTNTARVVRSHGYDFGPENTGTTATQAFSKGDYFMQDNQFAQATADIAEGDTVELGTNYRATTVGDELQALNNGLTAKDWQYVGLISSTSGSVTLPTGWKEIGVGMTLKHSAGGYAFYTMSKRALELASASKLVFGGYNFGCVLAYNSTAQTVGYDNYYSATVDLYFRVYVKM